MIRHRIPFPHA